MDPTETDEPGGSGMAPNAGGEDPAAVRPQLSAEDGARLRDMGRISPETYGRMFPNAAQTDQAVAPPAPAAPPTARDEIDAAIDLSAQRKADLDAQAAQNDREVADAHVRDMKRIMQFKIDADVRNGVAPDEIRKKYEPTLKVIRSYEPAPPAEEPSGMPNVAGGTASTEAPAGTLASDNVPRGTSAAGMPLTPAQAAAGAVTAMGLDHGLNLEEAAVAEASKVGQAKASEQSAYLDRTAADNERRVKTQEANEIERQRQVTAKAQDLEAATAELATQKIDPKHYWADKTTGDKVVAGIGLFLGAIGAGQTDGVNLAVRTMQQAIDKDVEIQKANYEIKKDSLQAKAGLYSKMVDRFKDTRAAEDATRIAYLDNAKLQVEAIGARHGSAETKAKASMLVSQIEQKKDLLKASFITQFQKMTPVDETTNPETLDKDKRERFVPGYGLALSDKDATVMKTAVGETKGSKDALNSLLAIANTPGAASNPAMRARADSEAAMLQGLLRTQVLGPGTVNDAERAMLESLVANPTKILSLDSNNKVKIQTLIQRLDKTLAAKAAGFGLKTREQKLGFTVGAK